MLQNGCMMKRMILGLTAAALISLPALADQTFRGTIRAVSPNTVWLNTSQGVVAVPTNTATFRSGRNFLNVRSLRPGRSVTVSTPTVMDQRYQRWDDDNDRWDRDNRGRGRGHWHNGRWYRD